jgi:hypothetical protein
MFFFRNRCRKSRNLPRFGTTDAREFQHGVILLSDPAQSLQKLVPLTKKQEPS